MSKDIHGNYLFLEINKICDRVLNQEFESGQAVLEIQKLLNIYTNQELQKSEGLSLETALPQLLSFEKKAYLIPLVDNYKLSITHLNNFLDVSRGGPENFINQNLLAIPMGQNISSRYGSAIHLILSKFIQEWKSVRAQSVQIPNLDSLLEDIPKYIREHLKKPSEAIAHIPKAEKQLTDFYEQVLLVLADFFGATQSLHASKGSSLGSLIQKYYQSGSVFWHKYHLVQTETKSKKLIINTGLDSGLGTNSNTWQNQVEIVQSQRQNQGQIQSQIGTYHLDDSDSSNHLSSEQFSKSQQKTKQAGDPILEMTIHGLLEDYECSLKNLISICSSMVAYQSNDLWDFVKDEKYKLAIQNQIHKHYQNQMQNFGEGFSDGQNGLEIFDFQKSFLRGDEGGESLFGGGLFGSLSDSLNGSLSDSSGNSLSNDLDYRFVGMETEVDFSYENIILDAGGSMEARLSGKIDFLEKYLYNTIRSEKGFLVVNDFKTGKPLESWKSSNEDEQIKSWKMQNQLLYYQILCQNSYRYRGYHVSMGRLIFVEAQKKWQNFFLEMEIDPEKSKNLSRLAQIVYQKIINLDFPDTSFYNEKYSKKLDAVQAFMDDLLDGKV